MIGPVLWWLYKHNIQRLDLFKRSKRAFLFKIISKIYVVLLLNFTIFLALWLHFVGALYYNNTVLNYSYVGHHTMGISFCELNVNSYNNNMMFFVGFFLKSNFSYIIKSRYRNFSVTKNVLFKDSYNESFG